VQPTDNRSKPSQLILIHPMDDFWWSGRGFKCRMGCNRLVFVLWAVENSAGKMSRPDHYPLSVQPTDNRSKPLLPNRHNWSWYIQWMILNGLEGDSKATETHWEKIFILFVILYLWLWIFEGFIPAEVVSCVLPPT
jgi:hypothetical protein